MAVLELIAFDFDHTLVDENSDVYVTKLAPGKKLPQCIKKLYHPDGWTPYMRAVFQYLHQHNVSPSDFYTCLAEIPFVHGMKELLQKLHESGNFEVIVISDANTVFINYILQNAKLNETVNEIFTNPAHFNSDGCLLLKEYHIQDHCSISSRNLCKGSILSDYVKRRRKEGVCFSKISYVGDGRNDFCPLLHLSEGDCAFPRTGYVLWKKLNETHSDVKANIYPWKTGFDIINVLCPAEHSN